MSNEALANKIASSIRKVEDLTSSIKITSKLLSHETATLHALLNQAATAAGVGAPGGITVYSGGQPKEA